MKDSKLFTSDEIGEEY